MSRPKLEAELDEDGCTTGWCCHAGVADDETGWGDEENRP